MGPWVSRSHSKVKTCPLLSDLAAQLTCQYIRLLRYYLVHKTPWKEALPRFQLRLEAYL